MMAHDHEDERAVNSGDESSLPNKLVLTPMPSGRSTTEPHEKLFLQDSGVYKSELVYKPSDYYNHRGKRFDDDDGDDDLEANEEKGTLLDPITEKKDRRRRRCILCCFSLWYVLFILILAGAIAVIKLAPKDPAVSFGSVTVSEFIYTPSANGAAQIEAAFSCALNVTNRNPRAKAVYDAIDLNVFYKGEALGKFSASPAPPFEQAKHTTTTIVESMPKTVTTIANQANADTLKTEVTNSNVQLDVDGSVRGRSKVLGVKVKKFDIAVLCTLNVSPGDGASRAASVLSVSCYFSN